MPVSNDDIRLKKIDLISSQKKIYQAQKDSQDIQQDLNMMIAQKQIEDLEAQAPQQ